MNFLRWTAKLAILATLANPFPFMHADNVRKSLPGNDYAHYARLNLHMHGEDARRKIAIWKPGLCSVGPRRVGNGR